MICFGITAIEKICFSFVMRGFEKILSQKHVEPIQKLNVQHQALISAEDVRVLGEWGVESVDGWADTRILL